jgi:hypothetical protein
LNVLASRAFIQIVGGCGGQSFGKPDAILSQALAPGVGHLAFGQRFFLGVIGIERTLQHPMRQRGQAGADFGDARVVEFA